MAKKLTVQRGISTTTRKRPKPKKQRQEPVSETLYDRVTGRTQEVVIVPPAPRRARSQLTVSLRPDQRAGLRELRGEIARTSGATLPAAAIIRGVLDGVTDARLNLAGCRTESDIRAAVRSQLTRR